jgi:hypothetical protein
MYEMLTFYKQRIEECKELARRSSGRANKAFWEEAALRWAAILQQYEKPSLAKSVADRAKTRRIKGSRKAAA